MPPNVQKLMARRLAPSGLAARHQACRAADAGKPVVRSLFRHDGGRAGFRRPRTRSSFRPAGACSISPTPRIRGYMLPFHLDSFSTNAQKLPSTSHAWRCSTARGTAADGPVAAGAPRGRRRAWPYTMGYFKREDIPFHYALAEAFTICDAYHCSVMGPTRPNRFYWMAARSIPRGRYGAPDQQQDAAGRPELEDLCRAAGGSRRQLEGLSAWTTVPASTSCACSASSWMRRPVRRCGQGHADPPSTASSNMMRCTIACRR
jgi:hypothetical protein